MMTEEERNKRNLEIASFRFGIISEFVTGVRLDYGDKERLIEEKARRQYRIPHSSRSSISRSSINDWVVRYKKAGQRIEGLYPRTRSDKGVPRKLDSAIKLAIIEEKKANPRLTVPAIIKRLQHRKILSPGETVSSTLVYKILKDNRLNKKNLEAEDRRKFEASHPNDLWQSDVMHGPRVFIKGVWKKSYLCAIIDDHSRLIMHAEFYPDETLLSLKHCLKHSLEKRGLPKSLYVDNGSCYRAINLDQLTACLGIALKHSRPYTPQGRGKIERWFKTVRDSFLATLPEKLTLAILNEQLDDWVEEYNNTVHSSTNETPLKRFQSNMQCVRPAPIDLLQYFRIIEFRMVKKDRTVRLNRKLYEAPTVLIDRRIELRYHQEDPGKIECFFEGKSFGFLIEVNESINARIGRDYFESSDSKKPQPSSMDQKDDHQSGQLFSKKGGHNA